MYVFCPAYDADDTAVEEKEAGRSGVADLLMLLLMMVISSPCGW